MVKYILNLEGGKFTLYFFIRNTKMNDMKKREKIEYKMPKSELQAEKVWKTFAGLKRLVCRLGVM